MDDGTIVTKNVIKIKEIVVHADVSQLLLIGWLPTCLCKNCC